MGQNIHIGRQQYNGTRWSLVFFTHHSKNELKKLEKKKIEYNNNNGVQTNINNE
jgi:hypothetical protein